MDKYTLIKQCQQGDLESFSELYRLYSPNALGTAYLIAGRKGLAEDILQEAFIQCFKNIKKLNHPVTFDAWFYRILVRTGQKMVSKFGNTVCVEDIGGENPDVKENETYYTNFDTYENRLDVNEALNKLSTQLKTVIVLYYYNEMTIKQIAKVLGCFEGTEIKAS